MVTIKAEIALKFTASLSETMESQRNALWGKKTEAGPLSEFEKGQKASFD